MAHKDPELAKIEAERNKAELQSLTAQIRRLLTTVPAKVIDGSHNLAISFKEAAYKGQKLIEGKRISLKDARECAAQLEKFYSKKQL